MKYTGTLIAVKDIEKSKQFYHDVLGMEVAADFGANVTLTGGLVLQTLETWQSFIHTSDVTLKSNSGELYFETEDMGAFYQHLESFDILYVHKLHEHPWGQRVVRFYDPDGHIIEAAEKLVIAFGWNHLPAGVRLTGFCVGMLGDAIFLLSVLCMKDSWRAGIPDKDKTELVTTCIYRFSRNPAFLGFDLMYVGVLLLYGNLLTLGFSVFAIVILHLQILQEERYLVNTFGAPYQEYCRHVSGIWDENKNF